MDNRFIRCLMFTLMTVLILAVTTNTGEALTRKVIENDGHVFTYSIKPNWKSGPITENEFDLWFKFYNDDKQPAIIHKILIDHPQKLNIPSRNYDDRIMIRHDGSEMNYDKSSGLITLTFNDELRGFIPGKVTKKRMVNVKFQSSKNVSINQPIHFEVIWSEADSSETNVIDLKKNVRIDTGSDNVKQDEVTSNQVPDNVKNNEKTAELPTDEARLKKLKQWFTNYLEVANSKETRMFYNYLDEKDNPADTIREILRKKIVLKEN